jgi:glutamyl-tRNA reductase
LLALGVDHRSAPASVREALAFDANKCGQGLHSLASHFPGNEFVILSTCNRVEIYSAGGSQSLLEAEDLANFLASIHDISSDMFYRHLINYRDQEVVNHLFKVAASLESLVFGEGQILGQVREAYRIANERKTVGPIFHAVFQTALRVGKLVRERTGMDQGKLSVASVAVDLAREVFDCFDDKTVLVIGTGKMGEATLQHLNSLKPGEILIVNRHIDRATNAAARWKGRVFPFDKLGEALIKADLVISTTAAPDPIVSLDLYQRVQRARRNRLALILDIAVPRDFDARIGTLDQVMLYHVDDLRAQAEQNRVNRQKAIDPALAIIEREAAVCYASLRHQQAAGVLLQQLGNHADQIRQRELDTFFATHPKLEEAERIAIAQMAMRLQNQLLHHPRAAVRSIIAEPHDDHEHSHRFLDAVRHVFGLGDRGNSSLKKI